MITKLAGLVFVWLAYITPAFAAENYQHPETKLLFPVTLGQFHQNNVVVYPQKPLGTSIGYLSENLGKMDIYIYDFGISGIEDGIKSEPVKQMIAMADADIHKLQKLGIYESLEPIMPLGTVIDVTSDQPKFSYQFLAVSYRLVVNHEKAKTSLLDKGQLNSILILTGLRNHFLKFRYTYSEEKAEEARKALTEVLDSFFKANLENNTSENLIEASW